MGKLFRMMIVSVFEKKAGLFLKHSAIKKQQGLFILTGVFF